MQVQANGDLCLMSDATGRPKRSGCRGRLDRLEQEHGGVPGQWQSRSTLVGGYGVA